MAELRRRAAVERSRRDEDENQDTREMGRDSDQASSAGPDHPPESLYLSPRHLVTGLEGVSRIEREIAGAGSRKRQGDVQTSLPLWWSCTPTPWNPASSHRKTNSTTSGMCRPTRTLMSNLTPNYSHISRLLATSSARDIARALLRDSSYSREGTESATTPPPAWK